MAWTLALLLACGTVVLLLYLRRIISEKRKNDFVYPSEAIIDQLLPPEIFEQIFTHADLKINTACSLVSKYWCHHATKDQIQGQIFRKEVAALSLNLDEFKREVGQYALRFDVDSIKPLYYPDNYPLEWKLEDLLFASRRRQRLLETSFDIARKIYSSHYRAYAKDKCDQLLIKLRGFMNYRYNNRWGLKDTACTNTHYSINMDKIPDGNKQTFTSNMECELIVDFKGVVAANNDLTSSVRKIRVLDYRKHFAGLPVGQIMVKIAFLLLLPCLIVDYRASPAVEFKYWASLILHTAATIVMALAFVTSIGNGPFPPIAAINPQADNRRKLFVGTLLTVVTVAICAMFPRWALEMTNYMMVCIGCGLYVAMADEVAKTKYKYSKLVAIIALTMVVLMNDWRLTVDAFKSGTIFWTFLYNLHLHVVFGALLAFNNIMQTIYSMGGLPWRSLFVWPDHNREVYFYTTFVLLFVTLYAPTTTTKVLN